MRRKFLFGVLAFLLSLVVLEVLLQLTSLVVRTMLVGAPRAADSADAITILSVGDSHTYGPPEERDLSYPVQLQQLLERRFPDRKFHILNLGVPGANSAFVATRLEQQILQTRPHLVLAWVGVNNAWNATDTAAWELSNIRMALRRALLSVKLYRMAITFWYDYSRPRHQPATPISMFSFQLGEEEVTFEQRAQEIAHDPAVRGLVFDMERMVKTSQALDAPILFIGYPAEYKLNDASHATLNDVIEATARSFGVPSVSCLSSRERARAEGKDDGDLIVMAFGPHPTGLLYGYLAEDLVSEVHATLKESHGIDLGAVDR